MSINFYDPIITKRRLNNDEPLIEKTDVKKIINGRIVLDEIPDKRAGCTVTCSINNIVYTWYEIKSGIPSLDTNNKIGTFLVDYVRGLVDFPMEANGENATILTFGSGVHFFPASRVYTQYQATGNYTYDVVETLQELTDKISTNNNTFEEAEDIRVANEIDRIRDESTRNENESTRIANENIREAKINEFVYKGQYNASTQYRVNNIVSYGNSTYLCIIDSKGNTPGNTTYWALQALAASINDTNSLTIGGKFKLVHNSSLGSMDIIAL